MVLGPFITWAEAKAMPCSKTASLCATRSTGTHAASALQSMAGAHCRTSHATRHTSHACRLVVEDVSSERIICRRPLQRDPYESLRVYVAAAPGKGEGLFAKIALEKGEVVAFYNGGTAAAA